MRFKTRVTIILIPSPIYLFTSTNAAAELDLIHPPAKPSHSPSDTT